MTSHRLVALAASLAAAGCGSSHSSACNTSDPNACGAGSVCENVSGGSPACFAPLIVTGQVTDLASGAAIPGARVVALDANRAPSSAVATTDASGSYALSVPATRHADGTPAPGAVTLRADAQTYQSFPGGVRAALPLDLSAATYASAAKQYQLSGALANVGLIPLPASVTAALGILRGTVQVPTSRVGVLVVAEPTTPGTLGTPWGQTAIADRDGSYVVFNVPGSSGGTAYQVQAYAQGVNYTAGAASVTPNASLSAAPVVNLSVGNSTTATVTGSVAFPSISAAPTSIALAVASTYSLNLDRGESPPGLVTQYQGTSTTYALAGVPDGSYVVLGAFGIDGLVRDVSSGSQTLPPLEVVVSGGAVTAAPAQLRITGAVDLTQIDGQTLDTSGAAVQLKNSLTAPTFAWAKGSSTANANAFTAIVYDSFGEALWSATQSGTGSGPWTAQYGVAGTPASPPALQGGMYYQLRVVADGTSGLQVSQTEDLKGVFFVP